MGYHQSSIEKLQSIYIYIYYSEIKTMQEQSFCWNPSIATNY